MTLQTSAPLDRISVNAYSKPVGEMVRLVNDGHLDLAPAYQRPSVWTPTQRRLLLRSYLIGLPVPAIIVNGRYVTWRQSEMAAHGSFLSAVVDGKQRLETLVQWMNGDLSIPASWLPADEVVHAIETDDGPYVTIEGLASPFRYGQMWLLPMVEAQLRSVAEEATMYGIVNTGGTPQSAEDIAAAAKVAAS